MYNVLTRCKMDDKRCFSFSFSAFFPLKMLFSTVQLVSWTSENMKDEFGFLLSVSLIYYNIIIFFSLKTVKSNFPIQKWVLPNAGIGIQELQRDFFYSISLWGKYSTLPVL